MRVCVFNVSLQVIVTEQEIDLEVLKEVKDKAEDYRKLKYYQVTRNFTYCNVTDRVPLIVALPLILTSLRIISS